MLKKYMLPAAAIIIIAIVYFAFSSKDSGTSLEAFRAETGDVIRTIQASGILEAGDSEEIRIPDGLKVLKVYVKENQSVVKGQVLAELDTGDLKYQIEKLRINGQQLVSELKELQRPSTLAEQESLKNGMILADKQYKELERQLSDAQDKLDQDKVLYDSGALSEEDFKASLSNRDSLDNKVSQAAVTLQNAQNAYKDYDRRKALAIAAKERQIAVNNTEMASLKQKIEDCRIKASVDGTLAEFSLREGRLPEPGSLIRILDLGRFVLRAEVPQEDAVLLKEGQPAYVKLKGLQRQYKAVVSEVKRYAAVDKSSSSRTPKVKIKLSLTELDSSLAAGYDADGYIEAGRTTGVIAVRREALRTAADGHVYAFLVVEGKAKRSEVVTGLQDDYLIEIKSGINKGDIVVSNPPENLSDGDKVSSIVKE